MANTKINLLDLKIPKPYIRFIYSGLKFTISLTDRVRKSLIIVEKYLKLKYIFKYWGTMLTKPSPDSLPEAKP